MIGRRKSDHEKIKTPINSFCILGDDRVFNAKSAAMFTAVMRNAYLNGAYVPYQVHPHHLGEAMKALNILNMAGANVTSPYKESAIPWMDELSEAAQIIGSINTIVIKENQRKGYNTNAIGITHALKSVDYKAANKPAIVFGTGGAARAVVFVLKWFKADPIFVVGRDFTKSQRLVKKLGGEAMELDDLSQVAKDIKLIFNATSVSSIHEGLELATSVQKMAPKNCELVFDLNYDKPDNFWQDLAQKHESEFKDGLVALAHQGSQTLALWTGTSIDPKEFLLALAQT
jgi:shikimate dehydrogenase